MPYIIYADIESLIRKTDECANSLENSSTTKIGEHNLLDVQCQLYELLLI